MKHIYILILLFAVSFGYSQENFNFELISVTPTPENAGGNDIWGWVSNTGTEYAVVGTTLSTVIYDLTDHSAPREVIIIPGDQTTWRDMKHWDDHIYVTADNASDGLLVIDMSEIATDSIRYQYLNPNIPTSTGEHRLESCHNLFIDENGFLYLAGCGNDSEAMNKAIIFDLNNDKWNPEFVAAHGGDRIPEYAHDLMVKDNIMYSSEIYQGVLAIFDVTDKVNIKLLGEAPTSFDFTHNAWVSDDGNYVFTTDERGNANVDAFDISDYENIKRVDKFQPIETAGQDVVPHNTHWINGYLVTSWYTDGVVITDANKPDNLVKVGAFDTYPDASGGTRGCWGAYPWLPSGHVLANDRTYGLHVLKPNYVRACYLEGTVRDMVDQSILNNVAVELVSAPAQFDITDPNGEYKTGTANNGTYEVKFSHPQYLDLITTADLVNGEVTILDVEMERRPEAVTVVLVDASTSDVIGEGSVLVNNSENEFLFATDVLGKFTFFTNPEPHDFVAGAWGYKQKVFDLTPESGELVVELEKGYEDDFIIDQGWKVAGDATGGVWERAVPVGTRTGGRIINIDEDVEGDIGDMAYVTGNGGGDAGTDDVDNGSTSLRSKHMFLEDYENPEVQFRTYFYNGGNFNGPPNDMMEVLLSDGTNFVTVLTLEENEDETWSDVIKINLNDYGLDTQEPVIISFKATDDAEMGHWVEGALDVFRVIDALPSSSEDLTEYQSISVFPNPTAELLNIQTDITDISTVTVYNASGQKVFTEAYSTKMDVSELPEGYYMMQFITKRDKKINSAFIVR